MTTLLIIGLVLLLSGFIWIVFESIIKEKYSVLLPALLITLGFMIMGVYQERRDYKQGQIDYHNGIIKYELKTNPDSTVTWEEIEE